MITTVRRRAALLGMALAGAVGLAIGVGVSHSGQAPNEAAVGAMVRKYILSHPELIVDAQEQLRIAPERAAIESPFANAWAGNPKGDVTLVIFTDYNCPYCRATAPELERLLAADPKLKVVWRELPVLGQGSDDAALAALAAAKQGQYLPFHHALFSGGRPDSAGLAVAAKVAALDLVKFAIDRHAPDVVAEVASNLALARRMQIAGTPFFVIGNRTYEGAMTQDVLVQAVAAARKSN